MCKRKRSSTEKLKSVDPVLSVNILKLDGFEELLLDEIVEVLNKNLPDAMDTPAPIKK